MSRTILKSDTLAEKLQEAGVIPDISTARRIIIDLQPGQPVRIYAEQYGAQEMLSLIMTDLGNIEIKVLPVKEAA